MVINKVTSNYYINDTKFTFAEVEQFLKEDHHIDLDHDRFLILQGEVESISMMPPKAQNPNETGLLEYLEDIIGSSKYTEDVETIRGNLERMREEKNEKQSNVSTIKASINDLHSEKEEMLNFLKLENKYYRLLLLADFSNFGRLKN